MKEIYTGIDEGIWNTTVAKSAGIEIPPVPVLEEFWEALDAQLNFEYEHADKLTLKK